MGTTVVYKKKPVASVGAVIMVSSFCPRLQTLHIVFDGSIPLLPFVIVTDADPLKGLGSCLRSVMPRLGTIRSKKEPPDVAERWRVVQHMLEGGDALARGGS